MAMFPHLGRLLSALQKTGGRTRAMKQNWGDEELAKHWLLTQEQLSWGSNRTDHSRLGFSALLKFFEFEGRFPNSRREIPLVVIDYLAVQLGLERSAFAN